ncbi:hypothetical protein EVB41_035 [Rhizobium phage RHph_TM3_14A]|nr:hypothetical protein EVB29_035 [Rhizobium phage RHph_TM27A]QIG66955.1 hypothetical protein EVB30_035 [Rhizobium phage RHph_TM27B]QIG67044.1 hypothetical protein EVB31_034 [Rhizobium phage RHph_TM29]QIG67500.1 hypothetical protein EVB41_035 [Rhizobium phage RHph_TM3_14A]
MVIKQLTKLKTNEEYRATAMLLGWAYSSTYHVFDRFPDDLDVYGWVDPDTLNEIKDRRLVPERKGVWKDKE